ncbi:hypothetical protein BGX28_009441 [Mortierella sp. GBA30]|nr:hypothetical protein BGX28_009441 [Mortierella sp. GBA30]
MLAVMAAIGIQLGLLIRLVSQDEYPSSSLMSTVLYLVSLTSAALLHWFEFFNMPNPSPILLLFWLFTSLISIFPTRSLIYESADGLSSTIPALKLAFTVATFLIFVLENFPKPNRSNLVRPDVTPRVQTNPSPEPSSNFFARVTFFWLLPLLRLGKRKTLRMEDIWNLHPKLLSYPLYLTTKAKMDAHEAMVIQRLKSQGNDNNEGAGNLRLSRTVLSKIVLGSVGYGFLAAIVPRIFWIAATYTRPVLFSNLIAFVVSYSPTSKEKGDQPQEPWIGFGLLIAVFSTSFIAALFDAQFLNINFKCSLRARGVFVNLIYRKSLRLSSTNKQEGMGSIVNHMSTDVDMVVALFQVLHYSWSAVVELVIAVVLLYNEVRYAMFASLGVIVIILSIGGYSSSHVGNSYDDMMTFSDERMKLITELVTFIKSIKLYAWESYFTGKIAKTRALQLKELRRFYIWITFISVWLISTVPLCVFATLSIYVAFASPNEPLDLRRMFTAITLIGMLEGPVRMINQNFSMIVEGKVCYDRLQEFFNSEEIDSRNVVKNTDTNASEFAYVIEQGTFGWYTPEAVKAAIEKKEKEKIDKAAEVAKAAKKSKTSDIKDSASASLSTLDEKLNGERKPEEENLAPNSSTSESTGDDMGPVLHDINLRIRRGTLTAVVGRVGEGKSSLVGALLGEMHKYSGTVHSYGSLAYVAQSAWMLNDTVRNNILFGKPYDKERYLNTVRACALAPDFKILINGDNTVIGEKGINLSGGQKQRISIARAVYADADIYIFDDPLSAVDAHVNRHIFEHVLIKLLAGKTRVVITNDVSHLAGVDQIVVMKQGCIFQDGAYEHLILNEQGDLFRLIQESKFMANKDENDDEDLDGLLDSTTEGSSIESVIASGTAGKDEKQNNVNDDTRSDGLVKRPSLKRAKSSIKDETIKVDVKDEVNDEVQVEGKVGWNVYKFYITKLGAFASILFVIVCLCSLAMDINTKMWLQRWGTEAELPVEKQHSAHYWTITYFAFVLSSALMLTVTIASFQLFMALRASRTLHTGMLAPLIHSPMSFFDVTSAGKIINRFAHDMLAVDIDLPSQFLNLILIMLWAGNIYAFCIGASYYFAIAMIPIGYVYYVLGGFYLVSSREIKRLDSATRSPLYSHFGETLGGLVTIRAYDETHRFATEATDLLDRSQQTSYLANAASRWLGFMFDMMSVLILSLVALLAILQRNTLQQGIFAVALSEIGNLTQVMNRIMSIGCQIETDVVAIERVREYSQLPSEACDVIPDSKTDKAWPQHGEIAFKDYSTRYREGLDLVLKKVSVTINGGERIGIVGRTGAGKSSVTLALFRIIEAAEGSISIDGINISTLGLHELRSRLTIIPQDPFLFGDSIRSNLDPFGRHSDTELWTALESASLKSYVSSLSEGLSATIENGGENMSLGQRQLMSLARAMLAKNTRVLCLDEATAAIDIETDNAIQRALRREFQGCTVLTIAHRINTIMDSDRILVLDNGEMKEYESPAKLLADSTSIFYSLAKESGNL